MSSVAYQIDKSTGLLSPAQFIISPNFDDRPEQAEISLLVVHCISLPPGEFGGSQINALFTNQLDPLDHPYFEQIHQLKVSSHIVIDRGGAATQFVPFHKRAWHAGQSHYQGRGQCNDFSIGIELEGSDNLAYEKEQYQALAQITKLLIESYTLLTIDSIVGHCDIAPERKTDPGPAFDWKYYRSLL